MSRKNKSGLYKARTGVLLFGTSPPSRNRHVSYAPTPKSYPDLHRLKIKWRSQQDAESQRCVHCMVFQPKFKARN